EEDCGTTNGVAMKALVEGGEVIEALRERILGRSVAADVVNPETQATLFHAGTLLGEDEVEEIEGLGIDEVKVRTPLTCDTRYGLCATCYGRDLGRGHVVNVGEAIGVIAAQSIGEPGTQLTMRTFHIGGAASRTAAASQLESKSAGTTGLSTLVVIDPKRRVGATAKGVRPQVKLLNEQGDEVKLAGSDQPVNITFQLGSIITVKDGQEVAVGEVLARVPQETSKTRDITGGLPRVAELFEARSPKDAGLLAEVTGTVSFGKDTKGTQRLVITDLDGVAHEYLIPKDKHVTAHDGKVVNKGETLIDAPADPN